MTMTKYFKSNHSLLPAIIPENLSAKFDIVEILEIASNFSNMIEVFTLANKSRCKTVDNIFYAQT